MEGVAWGAAAAIGLGLNSVLITLAARKWGVMWTTASSLSIAFLFLIAYVAVARLPFHWRAMMTPLLPILGVAAGTAYLASSQALKLGPLSVVSPIAATSGAMTVAFAFGFLGERPSVMQWLGIPLVAIGIVLTSLAGDDAVFRIVGLGPLFALAAVVTGAVSNAGLRIPIRSLGAINAIVIQRTYTIAFIWLVLSVVRQGRELIVSEGTTQASVVGRPPRAAHLPADGVWAKGSVLLAAIGALDAWSFLAFARGLAVAPAWLIGTVSQSGRGIAILGGILLFRERVSPHQWMGIGLIAMGLTLSVIG